MQIARLTSFCLNKIDQLIERYEAIMASHFPHLKSKDLK